MTTQANLFAGKYTFSYYCPHCGDLNPHHRMQPAIPAAPPRASQPSFLGSLGDTLQDYLREGTTWRMQRTIRGP